MPDLFAIASPLLRLMEPERAHAATLAALACGFGGRARWTPDPGLGVRCLGLDFPHPLGLAAGFDKDARAATALLALGLAFVEIGTVTPRAQPGNPRPRVFRLAEDRALVNRLGFNNRGAEAAARRLARRRPGGIVGANIGHGRRARDPVADYVACLRRLAPVADYVTVNVSSPNTPGLRALQGRERLRPLIAALLQAREGLAAAAGRPILLKLAPDLADGEAVEAATLAAELGLDGLVVANTTSARPPGLASRHGGEAGGLSGAPLAARSTSLLRLLYRETGGGLPLVGVGGIASAGDAYARIRAGASLLQLYTGLVFRGPHLIAEIVAGLASLLRRDGLDSIEEARGLDA